MTPDQLVAAAIAVAEEGVAAGELPIGAVVEFGGEVKDQYRRYRATAPPSGMRSWAASLVALPDPEDCPN